MMRVLFSIGFLLSASVAHAQHAHAPATAPYAGFEQREIKALSAQQIADYRAGRGMGLALAAELNGYPGPAHVLELASQLELTAEQRGRAQSLFDDMKAETIAIGERLIQQEAALDRLFADKAATTANLSSTTRAIGVTQAALRAAHLKYHLSMIEVLTPVQNARYVELRGYRVTRP